MRNGSVVHGRQFVSGAVLCASCGFASGQFIEPQVEVHREFAGPGVFGWAVSELRDIDGDGAMEAIVGGPYAGGVAYSLGDGVCRVFSGATGGVLMDLASEGEDENFGWSMADAGDVNGDGVVDVVVGATRRGGFAGSVYIYSGADVDGQGRGALIRRVDSFNGNELFGYAVTGLGDVDGDGFGEIAVGAAFSDLTVPAGINANEGRVYVLRGIDGSAMHTIDGWELGARFGSGIGAVGDLDGDGAMDFVVGSPGAGRADVFSGRTGAHLLGPLTPTAAVGSFGQFFAGPAGDVNADGTPDVYVGDYATRGGRGRAYVYNGVDGALLLSVDGGGNGTGTGFGCGRAAGDVDGDGHDDLVVGAYQGNSATVVSGRTGGPIRKITSTLTGASFGYDAVGIGDVTGDGRIDLLVGAGDGNRSFIIKGIDPCPSDMGAPFGVLDAGDISAFVNATLFDSEAADLNADGLTDLDDVVAFIVSYLSGCP